METITQEELKTFVRYNPETGEFTNINPRGGIVDGALLNRKEVAGYIVFKINRKTYKAHRMAFLYMTGEIPEYVDHINTVRDDNRWINLRPATWNQNQHNSSIRSDNNSGVKGVRWNGKSQKWMAEVKLNKRAYYLGMFTTVEEATEVINKKRAELHKEYQRAA